jgi:hypothetical protein
LAYRRYYAFSGSASAPILRATYVAGAFLQLFGEPVRVFVNESNLPGIMDGG